MQRTPRIIVSWSSGKDSAWMLHVLQHLHGKDAIAGLLTTTNAAFDRVAMHGVRRTLLEAQARALGLPLHVVPLPWPCPNEEYERLMAAAVASFVRSGCTHVAFGDLFLEDVRRYREERLRGTGIEPLFPLWHSATTAQLAGEMIESGLRARLVCIDPRRLDRSFAGREFDHSLLGDLPASVDPCGENGEFHSFAYDGPMFAAPLAVTTGEVVERDGFVFCDCDLA